MALLCHKQTVACVLDQKTLQVNLLKSQISEITCYYLKFQNGLAYLTVYSSSSLVRLVGVEGRSRQAEDHQREVEEGQGEVGEGERRLQIFGKAF